MTSYQREEDEEARDVTEHAAERDLKRTKHLEGGHQVRRPGNAPHVRQSEQHVGHYLRIVELPFESRCSDAHAKY